VSEGAFTFASQDYLAAALALGRSFVAHHPGRSFHLITIGEMQLPPVQAGITLLPGSELAVPGGRRFWFRYPLRELCAALKPFAFGHLFAAGGVERLLYLDADMLVLRPLQEAWSALGQADGLLVPALHALPLEGAAAGRLRTTLVRGAYDTAFMGLRRGSAASALLEWWGRQVFVDCRNAPADGLYLDRRFMDLVPGAFPGIEVLRHPGYNVDPWTLAALEGCPPDAGAERACLHFRGYDPSRPQRFRNELGIVDSAAVPALAEYTEHYTRILASPGMPVDGRGDGSRTLWLDNGIVHCRALAAVELQAARRRLHAPSPADDPDGFCRYATQADPRAYGAPVAPLVSALLALRPDVAAAFPAAATDRGDAGFLRWLHTCGVDEEKLGTLLQRFGHNLAAAHPVQRALDSQPAEQGLGAAAIYLQGDAGDAIARILDGYFSDAALRTSVPLLYDDRSVRAMASAMMARLVEFPAVAQGDLLAFARASQPCRDSLLLACLRYNPVVRRSLGGAPSVFRRDAIQALLAAHGQAAAWPAVEAALFDPAYAPPLDQLAECVSSDPSLAAIFPEAGTDADVAREQAHYILDGQGPVADQPGMAAWSRRLLEDLGRDAVFGINLCGLLRDASGMGELARAYGRALEQAPLPHCRMVLPGRVPSTTEASLDPRHRYGAFDRSLPVNLLVANPHSRAFVDEWLEGMRSPGQANIGAWAWETERMPAHFAGASAGMDAIFSISRFSADAIAASVDCPVHVVHPAPDFAALALASGDREAFGLPEDVLLFGFFFDTYSVLERKNPAGLLDAFRQAFGARRDVGLVLKVNSPDAGDYDFALLKQRARGLNVFWIEERLPQAAVYDLMASLDAYASLHRAEGFGLTMAEAMALGKPVVATGYSGNMDFMDAESALLVDYSVVATDRPHGAYPQGSRWANPSVRHCASLLGQLEDRALRERIGGVAARKVAATLEPAAAGRRIDALCRRILAAK
jgi:glycosyltransferase involved in cell wall biosynthesis